MYLICITRFWQRQFSAQQLLRQFVIQLLISREYGWIYQFMIVGKTKLNDHHSVTGCLLQRSGVRKLTGQLLFYTDLWLCLADFFSSRVGKSPNGGNTEDNP